VLVHLGPTRFSQFCMKPSEVSPSISRRNCHIIIGKGLHVNVILKRVPSNTDMGLQFPH
jgi:hypothetical protein